MPTAKPGEKAKKGKKLTKGIEGANVAVGRKKAPAVKSEAVGHMSFGATYICPYCGALNWFPAGWTVVICYNCHGTFVV